MKTGLTYFFRSDSGLHYEVRFGRKKNNILNTSIVFGVLDEEFEGEEYSITNRFEVYRVMSTVVSIVQKFLQQHPNVNTFEFCGEPTKKEFGKNSRIRLQLYNRYLNYIFDNSWVIEKHKTKTIVSKLDIKPELKQAI